MSFNVKLFKEYVTTSFPSFSVTTGSGRTISVKSAALVTFKVPNFVFAEKSKDLFVIFLTPVSSNDVNPVKYSKPLISPFNPLKLIVSTFAKSAVFTFSPLFNLTDESKPGNVV